MMTENNLKLPKVQTKNHIQMHAQHLAVLKHSYPTTDQGCSTE